MPASAIWVLACGAAWADEDPSQAPVGPIVTRSVGAAASAADLGPAAPPSAPQPAPAPPLAADLHEQVDRIAVRVKDLYGREEERSIAVTSFRPPGAGPFPLAIVSHGRAVQSRRHLQGRQRFEPLARWLVARGYAVFVPTRVGYGDTYGSFDPEYSGPCDANRFEAVGAAASDQVLATLAFARTLAWVDASRWVALGQSVGGLTTVAVAARRPAGLVAAVNFSGGAGGDPEARPGNSCGAAILERTWRQQAAGSEVPMLWLYWAHDRYWGETAPQRWAEAWRRGGGQLEFHQLPPWNTDPATDGHQGLAQDRRAWGPIVEAYLARRRAATTPGP